MTGKKKGKRSPSQKRKAPSLPPVRRTAVVAAAVLLVWSLLPLVNGICGVGVVIPAAVALGGLIWGLRRPKSAAEKTGKKGRKALLTIGIAALCGVVAVAAVMTGLMVSSAVRAPREGATVIVLGGKIYDSRPSRMLRARLDAAADYLEEHPTSNCVVSGGLGPGETYTEAEVMKRYLVNDRGIDAARIACEDTSTDTRENTAFSLAVIAEQGWSKDVAIATQVFHQYRAGCNARSAGATAVGGVSCFSPVHLMVNYWVRECAAICRLWLTGY